MRIHYVTVFDMETMEVLHDVSADYDGPVDLARGGKETRLNQQNQAASVAAGQAQQAFGPAISGYTAMANDPGYSDAEKSAITGGTFGPLNEAYQSAQDKAASHLARTRNPAGYADMLDEMARQRGRDVSQAGFNLTKSFADEAQRRKLAALHGLTGIYGVGSENQARLIGSVPSGGGFGINTPFGGFNVSG